MKQLAVLVLVVAACGVAERPPQTVSVPAATGAGAAPKDAGSAAALEVPPSHARRLPAPPPGCRPLVARAMPRPNIVHGWVPLPDHTEALVAADRLVVFQAADGAPERGEMFDPATDTWIPTASAGAPRYGSFKDGPGPLSGQRYFAFEDWVVVTWFDGNHGKQFSGAVFDARQNTWHAMSTAGMPPALEEAYEVGTAGTYVRLRTKGGCDGYRYDVHADRWSALPSAPAARTYPAVGASGGKVVVWGGILGETPGTGAVLDLATNTWKPTSTAGAPSGRYVPAASTVRDGLLVFWSGNSVRGGSADLRDGGVYDVAADRWTPIPAAHAPDPADDVDPVFVSWTGEALAVRELPANAPARSDPRRLAFWDPKLGDWWRSKITSTWPVLPLGFGRVLVLEGSPHLVHAREKLECPVTVSNLPIFAKGPTRFTATALIGDELVVWGRVDSPAPPPCPRGAPCARFVPVFTSVDDGAVVSP